jgi:hypothetical protein
MEEGHVPGARHIFLPELRKRVVNSIAQSRRRFIAERLSRQHRAQHFESRKVSTNSGMFRQLGSVEKSEAAVEGADGNERNGSASETKIHSARRCAPMFGGRSRSWSLSDCRSLSFIRHGLHFRERIIFW